LNSLWISTRNADDNKSVGGNEMSKRPLRFLTALSSLTLLIAAYSNCGPSQFKTFDLSSGEFTGQSTQGMSLSGIGIDRDLSPNCPKSPLTDFMESDSPLATRIEPRNCLILKVANPVLSWVQARDYQSGSLYSVRIKAESPATNLYDFTYSVDRPRLLTAATLNPGTYAWTVTYTKTDGSSVTSQPRRFVVPTPALYTVPSGATVADRVLAKAHPRILASGMTFSALGDRLRSSEYRPSFENYINSAPAYMDKAIPEVPANLTLSDFGGDQIKYDDWLRTLRHQILDERMIIELLGYSYHFTGNVTYRDRAIEHLKSLTTWPTDGATSEAVQDQVNREIFLLMAMGLDLFQDRLNQPNMQTVRDSLIANYKNRLAHVNFASFNRYPHDSHLLTAAGYALESMMYAAGTPGLAADDGRADLIRFWEQAITTWGTWGSTSDGGFANSNGYGWYGTDAAARLMATTRLMADLDLSAWPALSSFGDNQIAMTSPLASIRLPFGDDADATDYYDTYSGDTSRLIALVTGKPQYEWYWRVSPENVTNKWLFNPIHFMMIGAVSQLPSPVPTPNVPNSYLFEDAGFVAMHSQTTDPNRTSVFFRASRFGSFNHSHADQNSFTFISKGKDLFISGGVYDFFGSDFHRIVTRATRFKNALTFDGGIGQNEPSLAPSVPGAPYEAMNTGRLVNYYDDGTWAIASGDATKAYRGRNLDTGEESPLLSAADRTVAFNRKERVVVIYDWARSSTARKWELNFQTLASNSPTVVSDLIFRVQNDTSNACGQVYGPAGSYEVSTGWPGNLTPAKASPDQSRIRFSVKDKTQDFAAVTVIREDCRNVPVSVNFAGSEARIDINGSRLTINGLVVQTP
jgi:hypothetical protein